ncbi:preprotein translocase subunit YajC [Lapidilactobacillus luobeiensis]|uniref:preprotein translocase subunit YajC n=1 Tax=Lapidilactobacillus luobeiensis TaxID=2950371 RepID=UPI002852C9D5|nr:preprotein translocase subunit YajC [Lapidilactobacillus luobeiensis]
MIVLMFVVMYFTMIRPGKKQQNQRQEMLKGMKKGDDVVTIGGLHAKIDSIDDAAGTVVLDADGIYLTFNRSAIRTVTAAKAAVTPDENTEAATETTETTVDKEAAVDDDTKATTDAADKHDDDSADDSDQK